MIDLRDGAYITLIAWVCIIAVIIGVVFVVSRATPEFQEEPIGAPDELRLQKIAAIQDDIEYDGRRFKIDYTDGS